MNKILIGVLMSAFLTAPVQAQVPPPPLDVHVEVLAFYHDLSVPIIICAKAHSEFLPDQLTLSNYIKQKVKYIPQPQLNEIVNVANAKRAELLAKLANQRPDPVLCENVRKRISVIRALEVAFIESDKEEESTDDLAPSSPPAMTQAPSPPVTTAPPQPQAQAQGEHLSENDPPYQMLIAYHTSYILMSKCAAKFTGFSKDKSEYQCLYS